MGLCAMAGAGRGVTTDLLGAKRARKPNTALGSRAFYWGAVTGSNADRQPFSPPQAAPTSTASAAQGKRQRARQPKPAQIRISASALLRRRFPYHDFGRGARRGKGVHGYSNRSTIGRRVSTTNERAEIRQSRNMIMRVHMGFTTDSIHETPLHLFHYFWRDASKRLSAWEKTTKIAATLREVLFGMWCLVVGWVFLGWLRFPR